MAKKTDTTTKKTEKYTVNWRLEGLKKTALEAGSIVNLDPEDPETAKLVALGVITGDGNEVDEDITGDGDESESGEEKKEGGE